MKQPVPFTKRMRVQRALAQESVIPPSILCRSTRRTGLAAVAALAIAGHGASAGPITPTYLAATVQTPNFTTTCGSATSCFYGTETFSNWAGGNFTSTFKTGTSNFNATNYINGAYTAGGNVNWTRAAADQYGGSGGTLPYPELAGRSATADAYTIILTHSANIPGVNYFGIWISALDAKNGIQFYNNGQLLYTFASTDLQAALGACGITNLYCGNPTLPFKGQNPSEIYAYVNFFATVGYFDQVVLYAANGPGLESSNHTVAYINPVVANGTTFNAPDRPPSAAVSTRLGSLVVNVPEPATPILVVTALIVLISCYHRHQTGKAAAERNATEMIAARTRLKRRKRSRPKQFGWPAATPSRFSA